MSDDPPSEERLRRIEAHVAHLEHALDQLNEVVVAQDKLLRRLQAQSQHLSETMTTLELDRIRTNNPKPPHYQ